LGYIILSDGFVDELTTSHLGLGQVAPFCIHYIEPQVCRRLVRPQPIRAQLRLDVTQQRCQFALLCHPFSLQATLVRRELPGLRLRVSIRALKPRLLPALNLLPYRLEQSCHPPLVRALHLPRSLHVVHELLHSPPGVLDLFHLRESVEPVGNVCHQTPLVGLGDIAHILNVEQLRDTNLPMGNIKRHLHVATMIALIKRIVVDQVGAMDVKQGTEGQTVVPARTEVTDVHLIIASRLALTPKKQALLGRHALLVDVVNGESKNECPYKSEDNLPVTVHNVLCTNVRHLNATHLDEVEGQIGILEALDAQLWFGSVAAKRFLGKTFEQVNQYYLDSEEQGVRLA